MSTAGAATTTTTNLSPLSSSHTNPFSLSSNAPFSLLSPTSRTHKTFLAIASKNPISHITSQNKTDPDDKSLSIHSFDDEDDKPREEYGVVGIYGDPEASRLCYLALHALQHRGQEGAGIVAVNDDVLQSVTGVGFVADVFNEVKLMQLPSDLAIGHVRYFWPELDSWPMFSME